MQINSMRLPQPRARRKLSIARRLALVLATVVFSLGFAATVSWAEPVMRAHYIDVGQGAATLLEFPCGAILIDTGAQDEAHIEHLAEYLQTFFRDRPNLNNTLSSLIISHPHIDHTAGIRRVSQVCRILRLVDGGMLGSSGGRELKWLRDEVAAGRLNTLVREVSDSEIEALPDRNGLTDDALDPVSCDDCDPEILILSASMDVNPGWSKTNFKNANNHSLVVRVNFGESSFLFTGDLETPAQQTLVNYYRDTPTLDVDVYQVGHHASANGTSEALVEAMTPEIAIIGVGRWDFGRGDPTRINGGFNTFRFGHPRKDIVDLLSAYIPGRRGEPLTAKVFVRSAQPVDAIIRKRIYSTGWDGDVVLRADLARNYRVERRPTMEVASERLAVASRPAVSELAPVDSVSSPPQSAEQALPTDQRSPVRFEEASLAPATTQEPPVYSGMEYLGMLALGGFVGGFLCLGLNHIENMESYQKGVGFVFASAFAGVLLGFIQMWTTNDVHIKQGLSMYPVGLILALFWYYAAYAVENIRKKTYLDKTLGSLHLLAVIALTIFAILLAVPEAFTATRFGRDILKINSPTAPPATTND